MVEQGKQRRRPLKLSYPLLPLIATLVDYTREQSHPADKALRSLSELVAEAAFTTELKHLNLKQQH